MPHTPNILPNSYSGANEKVRLIINIFLHSQQMMKTTINLLRYYMNTAIQVLHFVAQNNFWENINCINYENLHAKYAVDQNFEHLTLLCNDIHPYHISSPREAPQAIYESVMVEYNICKYKMRQKGLFCNQETKFKK